MPDALEAAGRLGVSIPGEESSLFRGIRFIGAGGVSAAASFPAGFGIGVRRTTLHRVLVDHAERAGVDLHWGEPVSSMNADVVRTRSSTFRPRWIVGADGGSSRVRSWAGLDASSRDVRRFGFRRHHRIAPWTNSTEIYWGPAFQVYVTPVAPEEISAALLTRDPQLRLDDALVRFPELRACLA